MTSEQAHIVPVNSKKSERRVQESIADGVAISEYRPYLRQDYGEMIGVWGLSERALADWLDVEPEDWVLFVTGQDEVRYCLPVLDKLENSSLAERLWGQSKRTDSSDRSRYSLLLVLDRRSESMFENVSIGGITGDEYEEDPLIQLSSIELETMDDRLQETILDQHGTFENAFRASTEIEETGPPSPEQQQPVLERLHTLRQKLAAHRRLILYGPPGTKKYEIASRVADELGAGEQSISEPDTSWSERFGGQGRVDCVRFDANTTYEDFVERETTSTAGTEAGPLKQVCRKAEAATRRRSGKYASVLVIEQFGEVDLPEVFGEAVALFSSSTTEVTLRYSGEQLSLPETVHIIAVADTPGFSPTELPERLQGAFGFVQFSPEYEILAKRHGFIQEGTDYDRVLPLLQKQLADENDPLTAAIGRSIIALAKINKIIMTRDTYPNSWTATIGHAPLTPDIDSRDQLVDVWKYELLPLIVDRFAGDTETLRTEIFTDKTPEIFCEGIDAVDSKFTFEQLQSALKLITR